MKVSLFLIAFAVMFFNAVWAQDATREAGYAISNAISLSTGGNDGYSISDAIPLFTGGGSSDVAVALSNTLTLSTLLGDSGYGISGAVYIDTVLPAVASLSIARQVSGIHLDWEPVQGATSYKVYRGSSPYTPRSRMLLLGETTGTSWTDPFAHNLTKCFYLIITVQQ